MRQPCPEIERVLAVKARPPHQGQQLGVGVIAAIEQGRGMRPALAWMLLWMLGLLAGCSSPEMLVRQATLPGGAVVHEYDVSLHMPLVHAFDRVDLSAVVAEVWDLYEPLGEDKALHCTLTVVPDLQVLGDRNLIAQLLSNLLDNSIKY